MALCTEARIQFGHEGFGEAATDEKAVHFGQCGVVQHVHGNERGPGAAQGFQVVGVIKAEGRVTGVGDRHVALAGRRCWCDRARGWRCACDRQQAVNVHLGGDALADGAHLLFGLARFVGGHEAEMAFEDAQVFGVVHRP